MLIDSRMFHQMLQVDWKTFLLNQQVYFQTTLCSLSLHPFRDQQPFSFQTHKVGAKSEQKIYQLVRVL